jgi:hypothetical protein
MVDHQTMKIGNCGPRAPWTRSFEASIRQRPLAYAKYLRSSTLIPTNAHTPGMLNFFSLALFKPFFQQAMRALRAGRGTLPSYCYVRKKFRNSTSALAVRGVARRAGKLNAMGSSRSYFTDPNAFVREDKEDDDRSHWKTYDYVIVGGGRWRFRYDLWESLNR